MYCTLKTSMKEKQYYSESGLENLNHFFICHHLSTPTIIEAKISKLNKYWDLTDDWIYFCVNVLITPIFVYI